jgi:exopolyphosphatase / guanosine-5'-triphosphate,3'-diphosphate pyrophosphatase
MSVYAVIDVGTNAVKFHIAERLGDRSWRRLIDRAEVTRLGEGLRETGSIAPAAIERTVQAIADMEEEARRHHALAVVAVGTMGMRAARNSGQFIALVRECCGVAIEVISGDEEGRLAYLAVKSGLGLGAGRLVVFDTGGGSTQFTIGQGDTVDERYSLDVGAVRLTEQFGLGEAVTAEQLNTALAGISGEFGRLEAVARPDVLVGMGGAITNMTAVMCNMSSYDADVAQGSLLSRAEVERQVELYRTHSREERQQIIGLQPKRADVILAGACVVLTVMKKLDRESLTVSDRGLRHGVLIDRFGSRSDIVTKA